ncbi:hypothetical protein PV10_08789 [Exophiala mesophila]|uniref:BZIP domain-containing protein n=1 Tax=Exophiala mesophila TaxID=212818 RepID=A0A0D1XM02_EXOME|nr:uncharacterized protein PV10_08789 [Exophiala mesophila]KIV89201.1 hypothetical protein PV10_08789 [Exophiala mesophila]
MSPDTSSTASGGSKSKQERIRDNQRRSRARRQEYVSELERRLHDSHVTCREAELQRTALADLQMENTRLRALLRVVGVTSDVIESFGRENMTQRTIEATAARLRLLKPKIQSIDAPSLPAEYGTLFRDEPQPFNPSSTSTRPLNVTSGSSDCNQAYNVQYRHVPMNSFSFPDSQFNTPALADWTTSDENHDYSQINGTNFCCNAFQMPANGPLLSDTSNTVSCTMAKGLIEQYNPSAAEMDEIEDRLSTAFSRSPFPGQVCRVNSQVLSGIVNNLSAKQMGR